MAKRTDGKKQSIKISDLKNKVPKFLDEIQNGLLNNAKKLLKSSMTTAKNMSELIKAIKNKKIALTPLCGNADCEDIVKDKTGGAKTLNAPLKQSSVNGKCVACNKSAKYKIYIGKSY